MDTATILKVALSLAASFGSGWAGAVLTDVSPEKAIASGIIAMAAYWLGNQQVPTTLAKKIDVPK